MRNELLDYVVVQIFVLKRERIHNNDNVVAVKTFLQCQLTLSNLFIQNLLSLRLEPAACLMWRFTADGLMEMLNKTIL